MKLFSSLINLFFQEKTILHETSGVTFKRRRRVLSSSILKRDWQFTEEELFKYQHLLVHFRQKFRQFPDSYVCSCWSVSLYWCWRMWKNCSFWRWPRRVSKGSTPIIIFIPFLSLERNPMLLGASRSSSLKNQLADWFMIAARSTPCPIHPSCDRRPCGRILYGGRSQNAL